MARPGIKDLLSIRRSYVLIPNGCVWKDGYLWVDYGVGEWVYRAGGLEFKFQVELESVRYQLRMDRWVSDIKVSVYDGDLMESEIDGKLLLEPSLDSGLDVQAWIDLTMAKFLKIEPLLLG